jgi:hypothetical protein
MKLREIPNRLLPLLHQNTRRISPYDISREILQGKSYQGTFLERRGILLMHHFDRRLAYYPNINFD